MRLSNRFREEDKARVWGDTLYCALCGSNDNCSVHHIYGTVSSSIFNGIMLCHVHHKEADGHNKHVQGDKRRIRYLTIAIRACSKADHAITKKDRDFLLSVKDDFIMATDTLKEA